MSGKGGGRGRGGMRGGGGGRGGGRGRGTFGSSSRLVTLGGGGRKITTPNQSNSSYRNQNDTNPKVTVLNLQSSADPYDVIEFLKTKSHKPNMAIKGHVFQNQRLVLSLDRMEDVQTLVNLSGSRYQDDKITILRGDNIGRVTKVKDTKKSSIKDWGKQTSAKIETHLKTNYKDDGPLIDLSYIASTHTLNLNDAKVTRIIFNVVSEKCTKANTISFSHNNISSLSSFENMTIYKLDHIVNYSFDSNNISKFEELDHLSELPLRELFLLNNPIATMPNYRMEVARRFPDLKFLDSVPIGPNDFPPSPIPPLRPSFFESQDRQQFAARFLQKYLVGFDKNREEVEKAYFSESKFSMTFASNENNKGATKTYSRHSRNLLKSLDLLKRTNLLLSGSEKIKSFFKMFPTTTHNYESFVLDVFFVPAVSPGAPEALYIVTHGHFTETMFKTKRSFDRTFVLIPAPPGSEASMAGWEAVILNEQFHIRPYVRFPRLSETSQENNTTTTTTANTNGAPANEQELIGSFCAVTSLKEQFARECLATSGWDYNVALQKFNSFKEQGLIPETYYNK